ncbi:MAG: hypothetical protein IJ906_06510 [Oscillospiraceae bacterium]|nr:hypothetical protein [Oscillospiraceae bacterium]
MTDILTETPIWLEGKAINEVEFCNAFLQNRPLRCVNGRFYGTDGAVDDSTISYEISTMLTAHVNYGIAKKVQALTAALKLLIHSEPFKIRPDLSKTTRLISLVSCNNSIMTSGRSMTAFPMR